MQRKSIAFREFQNSIAVADALLKREGKYNDPPTPRNRKVVLGLRGGAAILMVAAFENYLLEVSEERIGEMMDRIGRPCQRSCPVKLPENMIYHNCQKTFHKLSTGKYPIKNPSTTDRVYYYLQASQATINGEIDSKFFTQLAKNNPGPDAVKALFKSLGVMDIFGSIKVSFDTEWGSPTTHIFITDTLDTILKRRHAAAHAVAVASLSRQDLQNSLRFIKILVKLLDNELYKHFKAIK